MSRTWTETERGGTATATPSDPNSGSPVEAHPGDSTREEPGRAASKQAEFEREALPHLDDLYSVALRFTGGDEPASDDLVQETMLKAYRAWDSFELGTNCRAWLLTILRNTFVSGYRERKRRPTRLEYEETRDHDGLAGGRLETRTEAYFNGEPDQEVLREIDRLPDPFRSVLVLSDIADLRYAEVAEVLGIPLGTVRSRLHRARQQLRRQLRDYAETMGYI